MIDKEKFKVGYTYKISMVMRKTGLSRSTIKREIELGRLRARQLRRGCDWMMEGEDLNNWWKSMPSNMDEYERLDYNYGRQ